MLKKVLIANRGEIALRVVRACHELGIQAVAVYSDADRLAPHVLHADEAYPIGPPPSAQSYLRADALIETAQRCGCDAVHPGYGFLSERAHFAQAVTDAGLIFVGPPASAVAAMGNKTEARRRMMAAGVPVVPGTREAASDVKAAQAEAKAIGFPVLLKAASGGGGKGMRVVRSAEELPRAFEGATHEARSAFGDDSVYLEKYLEGPRHIEIQVLGDSHGNIVHLGERECSIQRRHQKLLEEAPSPAITPELRARMGEAAVVAARAVDYANAGTIEFLFQDGEFYFLEMNTRIQVEHPVTELVTGLDLVQWQLRIAGGERLAFNQSDITWTGHAIECRITSEDPRNNFLPSTGRIDLLNVPAGGGVRWDGGIEAGSEVSLYYDPMLAKLIVHAPTRDAAIARMRRALDELIVVGVETSAPFHRRVFQERDFLQGHLTINYLEKHPEISTFERPRETLELAAVAAALLEEEKANRSSVPRIARTAQGQRQRGQSRSNGTGWRGDRSW
jgi:acetyl-CoA carboxylase biotin carboxylase subunit